MLSSLDFLRDITLLSVIVRLVLAVLCGGAIGIEREFKRRPAGFRTHILICLGAAMTTLTSQYLYLVLGQYTDMARLGAQVIAGIGFIGAGTIIVTRNRRVKGLTTAAGLWVAAIVGLCCGAGFYEGAVYTTFLVLVAEVFFAKLEYSLVRQDRVVNVFTEYTKPSCLEEMVSRCHILGAKIVDVEITKKSGEDGNSCAVLALRSRQGVSREDILREIAGIEGVISVMET